MPEIHWSLQLTQQKHTGQMLKKPSSKAADESKPEAYPQGYVEDFDESRTKLAGFFSILSLDIWNLPVNRSHPRIGKVSVDVRKAPATEELSD